MELTKEYFDSQFNEVKSSMATKDDLEDLAAMIQRGFNDVLERLDFTDRVTKLEKDVVSIKAALNLSEYP